MLRVRVSSGSPILSRLSPQVGNLHAAQADDWQCHGVTRLSLVAVVDEYIYIYRERQRDIRLCMFICSFRAFILVAYTQMQACLCAFCVQTSCCIAVRYSNAVENSSGAVRET